MRADTKDSFTPNAKGVVGDYTNGRPCASTFLNEPLMKYIGEIKVGYYDNSHSCGNCNGAGCRVCFGDLLNPSTGDLWKLRGQGQERFPLSQMINGCKPPYIQNPYAWNLSPVMTKYMIHQHRVINGRS
jgi:hypothetical protein